MDSQSISDSAVLQSVEILNENDCIGKINNITVMSRELVYDTRASYEATLNANYFFLEPLARQLLNQSRFGSSVVDQGRKQLILSRLDQLAKVLKADDTLAIHQAEIVDLQVGMTTDPKSNAYDDSADELQEFDLKNHYVDVKTKRFFGNVNAKLPENDADLCFKISPLRGIVQGQVQQAGLLAETAFIKTAQLIKEGQTVKKVSCDQMPCAVKIQFSFPVNSDLSANADRRVSISTCALTHGGQPVP